MKKLFHGDDQAGSRQALSQTLDKEKKTWSEVRSLDGSKITLVELESALTSVNLFTPESLVIENLFSRPVGTERKKLIELIKNYHGPKNLYFWDKKEITKTVINSASDKANPLESNLSKTPAIIFAFLDSLYPGNAPRAVELLHQAAAQVDDVFVFIMLSRLVAELLIAQSGDSSKLIPFKRSRLISQANKFSESQLLTLHSELIKIDRSIKTGATKMSYLEHLDLLLISLIN